MTGLILAAVLTVQLVCGDLGAERRFFVQALRFTDEGVTVRGGARVERLALGRERLELLHYAAAGAGIRASASSDDRDSQHIAIIVSDMQRAWAHVRRFKIRKVSTAPQVQPKSNPAAGGIAAVYFRDPEGHPLELLHFPSGKGAPQWHASAPLFLGIDHTAIGVTNTARSTRFYETLGRTVRGNTNNFGIEQERLSGHLG
jgi:catechol 2,3-dioxygenase-like lactoylglutathione lyase family enzyme